MKKGLRAFMHRFATRFASVSVLASAVLVTGCPDPQSADGTGDGTGGIDVESRDPPPETDDGTTTTMDASTAASLSGSSGDPEGSTSSSGEPESTGPDSSSSTSSDDGTTSGDESGSSTTMDCPSTAVTFEPIVPTVVLLVDQSGSMTANFGDSERWDAVRDALIDPVGGVIVTLQDEVRFGVALYTSQNGDDGGTCPILTEDAPEIGNLDDITTLFNGNTPQDETPTGESIEAVAAGLLADPSRGPKIIVVATDGEPDTCAQPNPQEGQSLAIEATEAAYGSGVETFIISVGSDISESHLQEMANAGVGWMPGDEDAPFYVPADQDALVADFREIINGVRSCVFELDSEILPGQEDQGTVTVNGVEIPYDDPDGWVVNDSAEIELLGAACQAIQDGDVDVQVEFTCQALVPG